MFRKRDPAAADAGAGRPGSQLVCRPLSTELHVPLGAEGRIVAWTFLIHRSADPLMVDVTVRSPSEATVLERSVLRSDLRAGLDVAHRFPGFSFGPANGRRFLELIFFEETIALPVLIPLHGVEAFLTASEEVVPLGSETDWINREFARLLEPDRA